MDISEDEEDKIEDPEMYDAIQVGLRETANKNNKSKSPSRSSPNKFNELTEVSRKKSTDEIQYEEFKIDENHFGASMSDSKKIRDEEVKALDDEVENEQFDNALKERDRGVAPRLDRLSNAVHEVSIDDFEMIRFLGDGAYGKVNLVK